jgi:hypothetical protein
MQPVSLFTVRRRISRTQHVHAFLVGTRLLFWSEAGYAGVGRPKHSGRVAFKSLSKKSLRTVNRAPGTARTPRTMRATDRALRCLQAHRRSRAGPPDGPSGVGARARARGKPLSRARARSRRSPAQCEKAARRIARGRTRQQVSDVRAADELLARPRRLENAKSDAEWTQRIQRREWPAWA